MDIAEKSVYYLLYFLQEMVRNVMVDLTTG